MNNTNIQLDSISHAIAEIRKGNFVIVVDNENRENEGDLIIAAEMITIEKVNFMETHARGLLCAPLTASRCDELHLHPMVSDNTSLHATPFTVSIDLLGSGCSTGISAYDRTQTLYALSQKDTKPCDFARPGHIFPLRARKGGVLERDGHTEAVVDLVSMAGLYPAGVLIEIKQADGSMARLPQLIDFANQYSLPIVTIEDLIEYRQQNEGKG